MRYSTLVKVFMLSCFCITLITTTRAHAILGFLFGAKNEAVDEMPTEPSSKLLPEASSEPSLISEQELIRLSNNLESEIGFIERGLENKNYEAARRSSLSLLRKVLQMKGENTKVKLKERVHLSFKFENGVNYFSDLQTQQKELVISTVLDFKGGLFVDIITLAKRARLLATKAFFLRMKEKNQLTDEVMNKIVNDLVEASLMPIEVVDREGVRITVFDNDIFTDDHTFEFNHEIRTYMIQEKIANMDELKFSELQKKLKITLGGAPPPEPFVDRFEEFKKCFQVASMSDWDYKRRECIEKYVKYIPSFDICLDYASMAGLYHSNSAEVCLNNFAPQH